jgi:phosphoribosylaminoimidazole-succinocarboxamide synthase
MRKESEQQPSFGDTLVNSTRKHQVLDVVTTSLSNCLSETNLHLTVPALKSKTRGKVSIQYFIHCLNLQIFDYYLFWIQ